MGGDMKKISAILTLLVILSGCYVQSLNLFYTSELVTPVPQILGEWESIVQLGKDVSNLKIHPWKFGEKAVETYDGENKFGELEVVYFKVNGNLFMDFTAGRMIPDKHYYPNIYWASAVLPCHSLCRVVLSKDTMIITPLDYDWFVDKIKKKQLSLKYIKPNYSTSNYVFISDSADWVDFLKKYGNDDRVFNPKRRFVFRKKRVR